MEDIEEVHRDVKNEPADNSSLTEAKRQEVSGQKTQKYLVNWDYKLPNEVNRTFAVQ